MAALAAYPSRVVPQTDRILDLLARYSQSATFFVLGWVAERHPQLIRRIAAAGHKIGCHSYQHRLIYDFSPVEFRKDTQRAMWTLFITRWQTRKRGACHLFRHTMATLMLETGAEIRFIQQMLGHERLDRAQIYTQVSIRQLKYIHSATHPALRLSR